MQVIRLIKNALFKSYLSWLVTIGNSWKLLQGIKEGQTHVDTPTYDPIAVWAHPIDIHYTTKGLQGNIASSFYSIPNLLKKK